MNFQLEDGIDDIIKYFENDLKVADGVTIYLDILEQSHFTPANILSGIKAIIKDTCDISFNIDFKISNDEVTVDLECELSCGINFKKKELI